MPDRAPFISLLVAFGNELRAAGMAVGTGDVSTYCAAVAALDPTDLLDLYWSGRTTLVTRREQIPVYDRVFRRFFLDESDDADPMKMTLKGERRVEAGDRTAIGGAGRRRSRGRGGRRSRANGIRCHRPARRSRSPCAPPKSSWLCGGSWRGSGGHRRADVPGGRRRLRPDAGPTCAEPFARRRAPTASQPSCSGAVVSCGRGRSS